MTDIVSMGVELSLVVVALLGAYHALSAYRAFKHDVMEQVFGFLSLAQLLVGGGAMLLLIGTLIGASDGYEGLMNIVVLISFTLILGGMIPLYKLLREATEGRNGQ